MISWLIYWLNNWIYYRSKHFYIAPYEADELETHKAYDLVRIKRLRFGGIIFVVDGFVTVSIICTVTMQIAD